MAFLQDKIRDIASAIQGSNPDFSRPESIADDFVAPAIRKLVGGKTPAEQEQDKMNAAVRGARETFNVGIQDRGGVAGEFRSHINSFEDMNNVKLTRPAFERDLDAFVADNIHDSRVQKLDAMYDKYKNIELYNTYIKVLRDMEEFYQDQEDWLNDESVAGNVKEAINQQINMFRKRTEA